MKVKKRDLAASFVLVGIIIASLANLRCQYDYNSPQPGTIEVHLKSISNNIAFIPLNNFVLKVSSVRADRSDGTVVLVQEDLKAIGRTANVFNVLDTRARDSSLVIGLEYVPPGDYVGIDLLVEPGSQVLLDGYRGVDVHTLPGFSDLLTFRKPFTVKESTPTKITLTIDLDQSLVRGAIVYYFVPDYYISSIQ